ncbi:MAG: DNA repair protein RadA [Candidatus Dormibacteraeota bacterium]|nr:DNA repair protein RadA [Candidatus Dormibacteraeota bacterium]
MVASAVPQPARRHTRPAFVCEACGAGTPKWSGRCPACGDWNSVVEAPRAEVARATAITGRAPVALAEVSGHVVPPLPTGLAEVDRVLGGGLVPGSVVLVGGDPGVGKSTFALQLAARLSGDAGALYCSGEESEAQIARRAERLGCAAAGLDLYVETDVEALVAAIDRRRPAVAVVDSMQTLFDPSVAGPPGSPSQVRSAVCHLVTVAKASEVPVLLIGHVTKEGAIAGPRMLEHMVDVVLYLEGERLGEQRVLRGVKNRFGSTGELGLLAMDGEGLSEVTAPHRAFVDERSLGVPGNVLTVTCDGVRPLAVEVQALAVPTNLAIPRRTCSGFDVNRCCLLLAVMEKRCSIPFGGCDVFVNAAGGLRLGDPGVDLAVALALAGSHRDRVLPAGWAALGEVGLGGEVRPVTRLGPRLKEAAVAGVTDVVVPSGTALPDGAQMRVHSVATLREALRHLA